MSFDHPADLKSLILKSYAPCQFFGQCREARWAPESGHIPRGFLGATGSLDEVELVMVFAEPGHPHPGEVYNAKASADAMLVAATQHAYSSFKGGQDQFHRNVRWFIEQLYPELSFDEQLRRVWMTEGRLCSIDNEIGGTTDKTCAKNYLRRQIGLFPNAVVVGFGGKAQKYLSGLGLDYISAYALSPPGANHIPARPSWNAAIENVRSRRRIA